MQRLYNVSVGDLNIESETTEKRYAIAYTMTEDWTVIIGLFHTGEPLPIKMD